jgi:hypothetical protein
LKTSFANVIMKIPDREIVRPVQNLASEMREFENPDI